MLIDSAINENEDYFLRVVKNLKLSKNPMSLGCKETAEIMMGKCDLSQRSYKSLKQILYHNNVKIPTYDQLRTYCKSIDVGDINPLHDKMDSCDCMGYGCDMKDTLQRIVNTHELFNKFSFFSVEQQKEISVFLKSKNADLYNKFDYSKRTR